ncbi:PLMN-like protein [Mya arenaria]|uniref:PLMN-like protein n=1 Tax=Mya arenaria TaxID=6604 RepID=A0ABY7DT57_MYAAR|nr:PLMN-like protein [Mya arenaria]
MHCLMVHNLAVKSEDCWDGVNSMAYSGKVAVTASGIECQAWSMDEPHSHGCHDPVNFPHDGSDVAAQNYCSNEIVDTLREAQSDLSNIEHDKSIRAIFVTEIYIIRLVNDKV